MTEHLYTVFVVVSILVLFIGVPTHWILTEHIKNKRLAESLEPTHTVSRANEYGGITTTVYSEKTGRILIRSDSGTTSSKPTRKPRKHNKKKRGW